MAGASCISAAPTATPTVMEAYLKRMRAVMEHHFRVPLGSIRITGIKVRSVTATTGDVEVQYALPASVVGNDNWVSYGYRRGRWKETSCQAPIGDESNSSTSSSATAPSCSASGLPTDAGVKQCSTNGDGTIAP